jgi:hypothetical protein
MPHLLGLIGDGLNLLGALVLALDILLRQREHKLKESLKERSSDAQKTGLKITRARGFLLTDPDFAENVLTRRSLIFGYVGVGLLATGFAFQALYHALEIHREHRVSETTQSKRSI